MCKNYDLYKCDIFSLGITFIECAFALHFVNIYPYAVKHAVFYELLKYTTLTENSATYITRTFDDEQVSYDVREKITCGKLIFSLREIYDRIAIIKITYPVLQQMIDNNPAYRIDIPAIITECDTQLAKIYSK